MTSLSASDWNFFSTWNGKNLVANEQPNTMGTPVWVKQAGGWVQGSLIYTQTNGTTPYYTTTISGGMGMTWEAVNFLLEHLGFTATLRQDYASYAYRGYSTYTFSTPSKALVPKWSDMQVREIVSYAYTLINLFEENKHATAGAPAAHEKPLSELEVEEW